MPRYSNFSATTPKKISNLIRENAHIQIILTAILFQVDIKNFNFYWGKFNGFPAISIKFQLWMRKFRIRIKETVG
jgi:hypothetical protein